jgi:hypothetical protein
VDGKKLKNGKTFASMEMDGKIGFADGIRCDEDGNVWAGMGWVGDGYDGVHVFAPDGRHSYRDDPHAGNRVQSRVWRQQAQPIVHDRQHVAIRHLRGNPWRQHRRLISRRSKEKARTPDGVRAFHWSLFRTVRYTRP